MSLVWMTEDHPPSMSTNAYIGDTGLVPTENCGVPLGGKLTHLVSEVLLSENSTKRQENEISKHC